MLTVRWRANRVRRYRHVYIDTMLSLFSLIFLLNAQEKCSRHFYSKEIFLGIFHIGPLILWLKGQPHTSTEFGFNTSDIRGKFQNSRIWFWWLHAKIYIFTMVQYVVFYSNLYYSWRGKPYSTALLVWRHISQYLCYSHVNPKLVWEISSWN